MPNQSPTITPGLATPAPGEALVTHPDARHSHLAWPFGGTEPSASTLAKQAMLLAFDGSTEADAAARVADVVARRHDAAVRIVSVVDTTPVAIPFPLGVAFAVASESVGRDLHREQEREVRDRVATAVGHPVAWTSTVMLGVPADAIAREGKRADTALILMGLRRHGRIDRVLHDETVLSVMRRAAAPVLAVAVGAAGLPRQALVAMDFGRASVHAAVIAAQLVAEGGVLTLAYVESAPEDPSRSGAGVLHALGLDTAFDRLERALGTDALRVDRVVLHHARPRSVSQLLLGYADGAGVDLLATGSVRHGRLEGVWLGSVSTELVRASRWSTLIVPPRAD